MKAKMTIVKDILGKIKTVHLGRKQINIHNSFTLTQIIESLNDIGIELDIIIIDEIQ